MDAKSFGAFIAEQRRTKNLTQADLAAKLNVTDKAVSRWERGIGFPDIGTIIPLAAALETSVLELMTTEHERELYLEHYPFRAYGIWVTADAITGMPQAMWEHIREGNKLYVIEELPDEDKAIISTSKKPGAPQMTVDASCIISKIGMDPYNEEDFPEVFSQHIRGGGLLYTIGIPKNGKILVTTSKGPGGITAMMGCYTDEEYVGTSFAEIGRFLDKYIHIIKDMDIPENTRIRACYKMSSFLGYCLTLPELDELTAVYRDLKDNNIIGYNPTAAATFTGMMLKKYPE